MSVKPNSRRRAHSMGGSFIRNNNRSTPMAFTTSRMPPLTRTTYKPKPFVPRLHVPIQGPLCKSHSTHSNSDEKLLSPSLASLDLPITSFSLPNFREVALSYISDMEQRLMSLDPKASQELALEEIASFMKEGMTLLERLKDEFGAHLPDFDFDEIFSFDHALADVRSKFSEFDFPDVRARLPDFDFHLFSRVSVSFDEARQRLSHLDLSIPSIPVPQSYILALRSRLSSLHDRISDLSLNSQNLTLSSMGTPGRMLAELLGDDDDDTNDGKILDLHGRDLARALASSCNGAKLIIYEVLPQKWRNNEFVHTGYRFIPFSSWPSLVLSIFRLHNETLNIHTHFLPLLCTIPFICPLAYFLKSLNLETSEFLPFLKSFSQSPSVVDAIPHYLFWCAAAACLACSTLWHVSAGCSDLWVLQCGARIDYVGIGWLISASVATVVYYGFKCSPNLLLAYVGLTVLTGIAGSIAPFQTWFDERKNKMLRIAFFLGLAGASILPIAHLAVLYGAKSAFYFIAPVFPSIISYLIGLVFYATHFPECMFPGRFDWGGSHAIWHIFIVIAIKKHWDAVQVLHRVAEGTVCSP